MFFLKYHAGKIKGCLNTLANLTNDILRKIFSLMSNKNRCLNICFNKEV